MEILLADMQYYCWAKMEKFCRQHTIKQNQCADTNSNKQNLKKILKIKFHLH